MEGVQSFEQRSTIDVESRGNRVIIANRREPNISWEDTKENSGGATTTITTNKKSPAQAHQQTAPGSSCFCTSIFCNLCLCREPAGAEPEKSLSHGRGQLRRRASEQSQTLTSYSSQISMQSTFDFGPFPSNVWKTSKYTFVNFIFKNLYEQFRRLANFYFLVTAIFQVLIPYSPIGPSTSLIPLAFVVGTTAVKQAYEDYLRHKLDNEVNHRVCCVLRENRRLEKVRSRDIRVGDIVYVKNNEEIPCDMILLASSGAGERCYITTANLDGETSLKGRTCFQIHQQVGDMDKINNTMLVVECEKPNATLYEFNGHLRAPKDEAAYESLVSDLKHLDEFRGNTSSCNSSQQQQQQQRSASLTTANNNNDKRLNIISTIFQRMKARSSHSNLGNKLSANQLKYIGAGNLLMDTTSSSRLHQHIDIPLDISNLLLRASRLRNTSFIYGLAVYTGPDTRLAYNSHVKPNKFSSLESRINMFLVIAFVLLLSLTLISTLKHKRHEAHTSLTTSDSRIATTTSNINMTERDDASTHRLMASTIKSLNANSFLEIFMAYFVLYNYLVPISLYVTLEFVKFLGTISVLEDKKLQGQVSASSISKESSPLPSADDKINDNDNDSQEGKQKQQAKKLAAAKHLVGPKCNSSDLNEDLGQVEVLFSDKTGTLTENKMHFMACSIQGHLYRSIGGQIYEQPEGLCFLPSLNVARKLSNISTNRYAALASDLARHHRSPHSLSTSGSETHSGVSRSSRSSSERLAKLPAHQRPFDHRHVPPMRDLKQVETMEQHQRVSEFLLCLCLCSTITLNEQMSLEQCLPKTDSVPMEHYDYQSASPDEESLITAAAQFGVVVCKSSERECFIAIRRPSIMPPGPGGGGNDSTAQQQQQEKGGVKFPTILPISHQQRSSAQTFKALVETKNSNEKYLVRHFERLITFEFNSVRKKMSVLYRDCDTNCVVMFTKGSEGVLDCISTPATSPQDKNYHPSPPPGVVAAAAAAVGGHQRVYERVINTTLGHFEAFSKSGLRTMLVAMRVVTLQDYEKLDQELKEARLLPMQDARELRKAQLYKRIESDMSLIGATAVEDSLQEGVPETIAHLKEAGIKVWLLTGDKVETAISVAYLCKLLDRNMNLLHLVRQQDSRACKDLLSSFVKAIKAAMLYGEDDTASLQDFNLSMGAQSVSKRPRLSHKFYQQPAAAHRHQDLKSLKDQRNNNANARANTMTDRQQTWGRQPLTSLSVSSLSSQPVSSGSGGGSKSMVAINEMDMPRFAMIADGRSLHYAMKYAKEELEFVCTKCVCVLGCRLSPLQKAEIVDMIKTSADEPITAAIGDGANDVSMIQEAHVGIGISGKEGRQAVNSSDFAINRFHMIGRLFFVHGHLFYHRTANTVHYFFYKNLLFIMPQFLYSFYNLSSATSLYHPIMLIAFNMLFTSIPILLYGLIEINIPMLLLETYPQLYRINNRNKKMGFVTFLLWMLMGTLQAVIAFFSIELIWDSPKPNIQANSLISPLDFSSILYTALILCVTLKLYFISRSRSWGFDFASIISCIIVPVTLYICSLFDLSKLFDDESLYHRYLKLIKEPTYWLAIMTVTAAMVIPDMIETICAEISYYRSLNSVIN